MLTGPRGMANTLLWAALQRLSLPRAVNGSLQTRISGGRMTQSGRQAPVGPPHASNESSRPKQVRRQRRLMGKRLFVKIALAAGKVEIVLAAEAF